LINETIIDTKVIKINYSGYKGCFLKENQVEIGLNPKSATPKRPA